MLHKKPNETDEEHEASHRALRSRIQALLDAEKDSYSKVCMGVELLRVAIKYALLGFDETKVVVGAPDIPPEIVEAALATGTHKLCGEIIYDTILEIRADKERDAAEAMSAAAGGKREENVQ